MTNRLVKESSPYLLQHAHNPVDWYPWGPEALERARTEDRPILLSVGYSACHWCHVMERESFEDEETAALMNESFVNVKVDREERPDVDAVYMRAVQSLTGRGGWPLTVFLTPSGEPYYGGTYYPPEPRQGMPSFRQVLQAVRDAWDRRREDVERAAGEIRSLLERSTRRRAAAEVAPTGGAERAEAEGPSQDLVTRARRSLSAAYDPRHGGFGDAPKFPQAVVLEALLRHHRATGDDESLSMVRHTLLQMARGGIRDHLGGGFHRYAVDARWLVPHFEKMLYDNALLTRVYVQAWQVTREPELREAAETALDWLLEDMRAPGGGFYAARDADSEGEEGRFYVWTPEQVEEVLEPEDARLFMEVYDVTESGNFEGRNILHLRRGLDDEARARDMDPGVLRAELESLRRVLEQARRQREEPLRDGKVLAGWNGLTVQALAEAGGALGRDDYVGAARAAMTWLLDVLRPEGPGGPLLHVWAVRSDDAHRTEATDGADRGASEAGAAATGEAKIPAFLEDVAALGNAALTLHEVTLERRWLDEARRMADRAVRDFRADDGLFYDTPREEAGGERLVIRPREVMDGATPSGTSLAAELCLRLGHLLGDEELLRVGRETVEGELDLVTRFPTGHGRLMSLAQTLVQPPVELAVVGEPDDPRTRGLLGVMLERYIPERTITGRSPGGSADGIPLLENREMLDGPDGSPAPTAWLCRDYACERPVTDPRELEEQFGRMEDGE